MRLFVIRCSLCRDARKLMNSRCLLRVLFCIHLSCTARWNGIKLHGVRGVFFCQSVIEFIQARWLLTETRSLLSRSLFRFFPSSISETMRTSLNQISCRYVGADVLRFLFIDLHYVAKYEAINKQSIETREARLRFARAHTIPSRTLLKNATFPARSTVR